MYKVYQFPNDKIPVLNGDLSDWSMVPESYVINTTQLLDERLEKGSQIPGKEDLDVQVIVGWNDSTNRVYFMVKDYDDLHNFDRKSPFAVGGDDIFEIVIDADNSGGSCFTNSDEWEAGQHKLQSVTAQNYHMFIPPGIGNLIWVWGIPRWLERKPFADGYCKYDGKQGSSGWLTMEMYVTPYDYASYLGPDRSAVHDLEEGDTIGLSWAFIDYDQIDKKPDGFYSLAHDFRMIRTADILPHFRLEPIEGLSPNALKADFDYLIIPGSNDRWAGKVKFTNKSTGNIEKYQWDFGDGTTSTEKEPTHQWNPFDLPNVTLTIKGPDGEKKKMKVVQPF